MSLQDMAERVGTVTDTQEADDGDREQREEIPLRDTDEYSGGWDTSH